MDECLLLECLTVDDVFCFELVAVDVCGLHDLVTVTVTVDCGQLPQSTATGLARGTAATSPNKETKTTLECILSKELRLKKKTEVKDSVFEDSDYRNQKPRK